MYRRIDTKIVGQIFYDFWKNTNGFFVFFLFFLLLLLFFFLFVCFFVCVCAKISQGMRYEHD